MALTGLFLISFLVIHAGINAMIFYNDGGETFSHWGHFMGTNPIIRTLEIGLVAGCSGNLIQQHVPLNTLSITLLRTVPGTREAWVYWERCYSSFWLFTQRISGYQTDRISLLPEKS